MDFMVGYTAKIDKIDLVKRAEDLGFTHFGAGEGPLLFSDAYQFLALAAQATSTINLGTYVTNPLTRIPPQTANSVATLNALAPGRTFLGIGAANNAMRSMGKRIAKVQEIDDSVRVIRGLLAGERVPYEWLGQTAPVEFLDPDSGWYNIADPVPIWLAAGGPRTLRVAAEQADVVVFCLGPDTNLIRAVRSFIDEKARAVGRDPKTVKLAAVTFFYLTDDGEGWQEAVAKGFGSAPLSSAMTNLRFMQDHVDQLGESIVAQAAQAATAFLSPPPDDGRDDHHLESYRNYLKGVDPGNKDLITQELVDYFTIYGTAEECQAKASAMLDAGVDLLSVFLSNPATFEKDMSDISSTLIHAV